MAYGEGTLKMEKKSLVTLLENGSIKIETIYRLDPNFDAFITSDGVKSPDNLRNVTIGINGKEIPEDNFQEYQMVDGAYRFIALKQSLTSYTNINEVNEVYVRYEYKLPTSITIPN